MFDKSPRPDLKPGDIVRRRKGPVMHVGVVVGEDRILHNLPGRGEHVVSFDEFARGRRVYVESQSPEAGLRARACGRTPMHAPERRGYNLLSNNCEHTVHRAVDGSPASPQFVGLLAGAGAGAVAFAFTRSPSFAVAGWAFGKQVGERIIKHRRFNR